MKNAILLHNPLDAISIKFKEHLDSVGYKYCLLNWYSNNNHPKQIEETFRLINMHLTGAIEGLAPPDAEIEYTDKDIEEFSYPNEYDRWIMRCECHKGEGYFGPPPRAFPSIVFEHEDGKGYTLIDTPETLKDIIDPDYNKVWGCKAGECLAGQAIESAKTCALSPFWSNAIIRESVKRFVLKFETIDLKDNREAVTIKMKTKEESHG